MSNIKNIKTTNIKTTNKKIPLETIKNNETIKDNKKLNTKKNKKIENNDADGEGENTSDNDSDLICDDSDNNTQEPEIKRKYGKQKKIIMNLNDDENKPVSAGGAMIYKITDGAMRFLMIKNCGLFEDIGGKIDDTDEDIYTAVAREVEEETNKQILAKNIIKRIKKAEYVYVPRSKYVVFFVEATDNEKKLKKTDFGEYELHDNFPRIIGWLTRSEFAKSNVIKFKLNFRLKNKNIFDKLMQIEQCDVIRAPSKNLFKKVTKN